ncbi:MAG: T9SS type A sorting domain-containing protein [Bacteroidetes bacterium]|nr:T9SS type A sorting domain-containing protein [Bacteroidota bacterium]
MRKHLFLFVVLVLTAFTMNAQVPEYWYLDEVNPGMDIALYPDGTNPQDGLFACQMTLLQPEIPYLISDNFAVTEGSEYTFTIWYYDNDSRASLKFYADFYDSEGNDIYGEDPVYSEDGDMWQSVSWSSTVPAGAVEGYILIKLYDDEGYVDEAIVWVDNVSFMVGSENLVLNGSYESWPGVGVEEPTAQPDMQVFPNPVYNEVNISNLQGVDRIEIADATGSAIRVIEDVKGETLKFQVEELSTGLYFMSFYNRDGWVATKKILKR